MKSFDILWHDDVMIVDNRRYKAGDVMTTYLNLNIDKLDVLINSCANPDKKQEVFILTDKLVSKLPPYNRSASDSADLPEGSYVSALETLRFCRDKASVFFDRIGDGAETLTAWEESFPEKSEDTGSLCAALCAADGTVCSVCRNAGLKEFVHLAFLLSIRSGVRPRRCGCCEKYFLPNNPIAKFCDRKAPGSGGKTCREIGARKKYGEKAKNDPVITVYNRAYKTRYARVTNGKMTRAQLEDWKAAASSYREKAAAGLISIEEFEQKLTKI